MTKVTPPRILVIDDLFGRDVAGTVNRERENLCGKFLLREESLSGQSISSRFEIPAPIARAVFCRGQIPNTSTVGEVVENDLSGSMETVRQGWSHAIERGKAPWSMVLLDLCFYTGKVTEESHRRTPGMPEGRIEDDDPRKYFGLSLLDAIHKEFPELPVMILSSKPRGEVSLEFSRRGALGFIDRSDPKGAELLEAALWHHGLLADTDGTVVGNSLPVLLALREARRAAWNRETILIRGERGTGKELIANYIHRVSAKTIAGDERSFVTVNSAILTQNLFASELFGIEAKTATGVDGKAGLIETANGGDLFLDEIADMPLEVQAAMLRVLQDRQITPVGARRPKAVDVRFLSATNADLEDKARGFRPDLLDRLRLGGTIWLPPLRERKADIPLLARKFIREAERQRPGIRRREATPEALELLQSLEWPGNVRDLRTCIFDAVNRFPDVEHLVPSHLRISSIELGEAPNPSASSLSEDTTLDSPPTESLELETILSLADRITFDQKEIGKWTGRLPDLQTSFAKLQAKYLLAALDATKRRTPEHPEGIIQIHPAIKLLTGNQKITASGAADIIKRLLSPMEGELKGDLRKAFDTAIRLRPRSTKSSQIRKH